MSENKPRPPGRKATLIAPVAIASAVAILLLVAVSLRSYSTPSEPAPPPPVATSVEESRTPIVVPPEPPLDRRQLILAAADVAAAYAAGEPPVQGDSPLIGRRFTLRLPFGCEGPLAGPGQAQAYAEYDAAKKTVRLVARPGDWSDVPVVQSLVQVPKIEAAEGFWIPQPWSYSEACPPSKVSTNVTPIPPAAPSLGLVRLFDAQSSRVLRRDGRAYEFARKIPEDEPALLKHRYSLVLSGRITGFADGAAIRCRSQTSAQRPICVFAVEFERVAFEDADSDTLLAEWRE